mmetsp:Transcript_27344/g.78218  ORF Transcript_27344/g.78218 Transcript_27344/m.78218 type:complete len:217 (+) Transcript_27344:1544-2194(+)
MPLRHLHRRHSQEHKTLSRRTSSRQHPAKRRRRRQTATAMRGPRPPRKCRHSAPLRPPRRGRSRCKRFCCSMPSPPEAPPRPSSQRHPAWLPNGQRPAWVQPPPPCRCRPRWWPRWWRLWRRRSWLCRHRRRATAGPPTSQHRPIRGCWRLALRRSCWPSLPPSPPRRESPYLEAAPSPRPCQARSKVRPRRRAETRRSRARGRGAASKPSDPLGP